MTTTTIPATPPGGIVGPAAAAPGPLGAAAASPSITFAAYRFAVTNWQAMPCEATAEEVRRTYRAFVEAYLPNDTEGARELLIETVNLKLDEALP